MAWNKGKPPSQNGQALIATGISLSVVVVVFAIARFYTRRLQRIKFGIDDWVFLIAVVAIVTRGIFYVTLVETTGFGSHRSQLANPAYDIPKTRKGFYVLEIFDIPLTVTPAKISLLLFYRRIFFTRCFQITSAVIGFIILGLGIATLFQTIFQCSPISLAWERDPWQAVAVNGVCIDQALFYRVITPINLLTGVMITLLPIPWVWKLHLPSGQKWAVISVFLLSGLGTVASAIRVASFFKRTRTKLSDTSSLLGNIGIVVLVESAVIIIAICLVGIWPLVCHMVPRSWRMRFAIFNHRCRSSDNHYDTSSNHRDTSSGNRRDVSSDDHSCWYMGTVTRTVSIEPKTSTQTRDFEDMISWDSRPSSITEIEDQWLGINDEDYYPPSYSIRSVSVNGKSV